MRVMKKKKETPYLQKENPLYLMLLDGLRKTIKAAKEGTLVIADLESLLYMVEKDKKEKE